MEILEQAVQHTGVPTYIIVDKEGLLFKNTPVFRGGYRKKELMKALEK